MRKIGQFKYARVVMAYSLILILFLFIVISVIISHHNEMMEEMHHGARRELGLIASFARDALLRQDYAAVEHLLNSWADEHEEIIQLRAVAPNSFDLVNFQRTSASALSFHLTQEVSFEGRELLHLEMIKDMSQAQISMLRLRFRLIAGSILITFILGLVLWYVMRKLALAPMEKEIIMKERAEKKFRMLLESAPDAIVYSDRKGKILMVNGETEKLFGYRRSDLEGRDVELLMPQRFHESHRAMRMKFIGDGDSRPMEASLEMYGRTQDGREFPADINVGLIDTEEGLFFLSSIRDISERKRSEEKIRRGYIFQTTISKILRISLEPVSFEEQLHRILDVILTIPCLSAESGGSIYLMNKEGKSMNLAARRGSTSLELQNQQSMPVADYICGSAALNQRISFINCTGRQEGKAGSCAYTSPHGHYCVPIMTGDRNLGVIDLLVREEHRRMRDEEEFLLSAANTIAGIIEHHEANREMHQLQTELAQAEKMSALGRLTANVAHEIRNPLTLIGGFARKLSRNVYEGQKDREYSNIIVAQVSRLEKILKNVLTYSREAQLDRDEHDINLVIEEVVKTYQNECTKRAIQISCEYGEIPFISIDRDQVWMVLNNLFANACDSMHDGGSLRITTALSSANQKEYVVVTLSDTGTGIPRDQIKAIFEPFFTTKVLGQGTGLGLSISKKIMEDHGGFIKVMSNLQQGTTFSLHFPVRIQKNHSAKEP